MDAGRTTSLPTETSDAVYTIIAHPPEGYRVIVEYDEPARALEAFESACKRALVTVGTKVLLLDDGKLVSEFTGPPARPARNLANLLRQFGPAEEGSRLGGGVTTTLDAAGIGMAMITAILGAVL